MICEAFTIYFCYVTVSPTYDKEISSSLSSQELPFLPQENKFLKFLSFMWNPLSWVMEAAAAMAIALANGGVS